MHSSNVQNKSRNTNEIVIMTKNNDDDDNDNDNHSSETDDYDIMEQSSLLQQYNMSTSSRKRPMPQIQRLKKRQLRHREEQKHHIYRGARRILYFVLIVPLFFLMLLYIALYSNVQMRYVPHRDWGYNTSRTISDYVLPEKKTNILQPNYVCHEKLFLIIIVCSSLQNFAARQMIRETWGNTSEFNYNKFAEQHHHVKGQYLQPSNDRIQYYADYLHIKTTNNKTIVENATILNDMKNNLSNKNDDYLFRQVEVPVRVLFIVGRYKKDEDESSVNEHDIETRLKQESIEHNDIIQENFMDTYNNLTIKSVLALKWLTQNCLNQAAYFMKCDDDTFVNVPNLLHYLLGGTMPIYNDTFELYDHDPLVPSSRLKINKNYLSGYLFCTARPIANISSKWYMPYYMYPYDQYPPYLSGAGYVMSSDVAIKLYEIALNTTLVYVEDVYVTGICAQKLKLKRKHQPLFAYTRAKKFCQFKGTFTQHDMKDDSLYDAYAFVMNASQICSTPSLERLFHRMRLHKNNYCV